MNRCFMCAAVDKQGGGGGSWMRNICSAWETGIAQPARNLNILRGTTNLE
jgi:hypothetical protein